jgi:hypothetical protein
MKITITIPDAIAPTITAALAAKVSDRNDLPNETTQEKAIRRLREMARQDVVDKIRIDAFVSAQSTINAYADQANAALDNPSNHVDIEVS